MHALLSSPLPAALLICAQSAAHQHAEVFAGHWHIASGGVLEETGLGFCRYDSPLKPVTSRLLHVGDSAGNRSALSFAGACMQAPCPGPSHVCLQ